MSLYLVQHGKNLPKEEDPEQSLSATGKADTERIAQVAALYNIPVSVIRHSSKKRAKETAEIMAAALNPDQGIKEVEGLKALDDVTALAETVDAESNIMLVGHLPSLDRLAALLITGNQENSVISFQNGGIVCLHQPEAGQWSIKWSLMPDIS